MATEALLGASADSLLSISLQLDDLDESVRNLSLSGDASASDMMIALRIAQEELLLHPMFASNDTTPTSETHDGQASPSTGPEQPLASHPTKNDSPVSSVNEKISERADKMHSPQKSGTVECVVCGMDKLHAEVHTTVCKHHLCGSCIEEQVRACMHDRTMYPPRCCEVLDRDASLDLIPTDLAQQFLGKCEELEDKIPKYCHACSTYLGAAQKQDHTGKCRVCEELTCLLCSNISHDGDCPKDPAIIATRALAAEEGWQACKCGAVIELHGGCNHIT